jgi:hypothetical protein
LLPVFSSRCLLLCSLAASPLARSRAFLAQSRFRLAISSRANTDRADVKEWHPAQVPGVVQTDLLSNKLIPDPSIATTNSICSGSAWPTGNIKPRFKSMPPLSAHDHVDLVFDGLDTFADVYLNESSDSPCRQHVPPLANPGKADC